jgi:hypothetical protein
MCPRKRNFSILVPSFFVKWQKVPKNCCNYTNVDIFTVCSTKKWEKEKIHVIAGHNKKDLTDFTENLKESHHDEPTKDLNISNDDNNNNNIGNSNNSSNGNRARNYPRSRGGGSNRVRTACPRTSHRARAINLTQICETSQPNINKKYPFLGPTERKKKRKHIFAIPNSVKNCWLTGQKVKKLNSV